MDSGDLLADESSLGASSTSSASPVPDAVAALEVIQSLEELGNLVRGSTYDPIDFGCDFHTVADYFGTLAVNRYVCHTVYRFDQTGPAGNIAKYVRDTCSDIPFYRETESCGTWAVAEHIYGEGTIGSHIHVLHICASRDKHTDCRCGGIAKWKPFGFVTERRRYIKSGDKRRGRQLLLYLQKGE